jgi:hypothetical protein
LNSFAFLFLIGCIVYTIVNYAELSEGEGWGVVGMVGLCGFGILLLVIDIVIQNIFKNRMTANIIGLIVSITAILLLLMSGLRH